MFPLPNFFRLLNKYHNAHHNKKIELKTAFVSGLFALSFFVNISLIITPRSLIFLLLLEFEHSNLPIARAGQALANPLIYIPFWSYIINVENLYGRRYYFSGHSLLFLSRWIFSLLFGLFLIMKISLFNTYLTCLNALI